MEVWEIVLLLVGGWVAVMSLVRMMRARRDLLVSQVKQQFAAHRRQEAEAAEKRKQEEEAA